MLKDVDGFLQREPGGEETSKNAQLAPHHARCSGTRGVVMLYQSDNGLCGWFGYAGYLAGRGFHVCCSTAAAPATPAAPPARRATPPTWPPPSATLRRSGARKVAVVGASAWGAVAIGSCVVVDIRGCVALSPALFDLKLGDRLTANIAIARVRAPLLVADAPDDSDSPITEVQTLLRRARPGVVLFVRLPAAAGTAGTPSTTPTTLIAAQRSPPASPPSSTAT